MAVQAMPMIAVKVIETYRSQSPRPPAACAVRRPRSAKPSIVRNLSMDSALIAASVALQPRRGIELVKSRARIVEAPVYPKLQLVDLSWARD
jgi:hypothetical protein